MSIARKSGGWVKEIRAVAPIRSGHNTLEPAYGATMASSEASYPTANGKRFTLDVDTQADVPPYQDWAHTDRLDNFTVMEVAGKSRCHGMHLEGMAY